MRLIDARAEARAEVWPTGPSACLTRTASQA
jgi:hypothetical protein